MSAGDLATLEGTVNTLRSRARSSVMRFLNEVADDYPEAISFASGRPADVLFDVDDWLDAVSVYQRHIAGKNGGDYTSAGRRLAQYGRTAGMINDLIAGQLARDEGIDCTPERIVVTAGCQEAIVLCFQALCADPRDVVLVRNPTYIGATGVAELSGIEVVPLENHPEGDCAAALQATIARTAMRGKRPRVLYLIPQFDNPTGSVLSLTERTSILRVCNENRIVVIEDNPYGMFRFEETAEPPMAALDEHGCVIYLATYSKTLCPAVRVGCAVVPPTLFGDAAASRELLAELIERKSFLTVNTSQLNQALVGGVLLCEGGTLARLVEPARALYRRNRDVLLECLETEFSAPGSGVTWNRPKGGFFLSVELPFRVDSNDLVECAADYRVVVMPMSFFALDDSQDRRVRFSFSNLTPDEIVNGVESFARYVNGRLAGGAR